MQQTSSSMSTEDLCRRSIAIMGDGSPLEAFEEVIHPLAVNREAASEPPATRGLGPRAYHATALWLQAAFSPLSWDIHEVVVDGPLAVVHCTMSGRQVGPMVEYDAAGAVAQAFPSTGRSFASTQTHWLRIADGMIIEHWANRDDIGMAQQLGWIPPSPRFLVRMALATRAARRRARAEGA